MRSIGRDPAIYACHISDRQIINPFKGHHVIDINIKKMWQLQTFILTMAHEMCHIRESMTPPYTGSAHGKLFHKLADEVCRIHGFDRGAF